MVGPLLSEETLTETAVYVFIRMCRNSVLVLLVSNKCSVQGQEQNDKSLLDWESGNVYVNFKPFQEKSSYNNPCACLPRHTPRIFPGMRHALH